MIKIYEIFYRNYIGRCFNERIDVGQQGTCSRAVGGGR